MNWKITLLFCCALYCVSGKSVLRQYPQNFKNVDESNEINSEESSEEDMSVGQGDAEFEKNPRDENTNSIKKINIKNDDTDSSEIDVEEANEIANDDNIDGNNVDKGNHVAGTDNAIDGEDVAADEIDNLENEKISETQEETESEKDNEKTADHDGNDGNNVDENDNVDDIEHKAAAIDDTNGLDYEKVGETRKESIINNVDNNIEDSERKFPLPNFGNIENLAKQTLQNIAQISFSNSNLKKMMQQFPALEIDKLAEKVSDAVDFFSQDEQEEKFESDMNHPVFAAENQEAGINDNNMKDYMETIQRDQGMIDNKDGAVLAPDYQQVIKSLPKLLQFVNSKISADKKEPVQIQKDEPKVGFQKFGINFSSLKFGSITEYMKKTVDNAKTQLKKLGPRIESKNPPLHINEIPGTLITLKLKYVEGASSLLPFGDSKGVYYNKMYAFTQFKFEKLKYYYDVVIEPLGLFTINSKMSITLNDALAKMHVTVEKSKQMRLLNFEFVQSKVYIDYGGNPIMSYALNYIINNVHPVVKKKVTEIVSRDSKLMLEDFIRGAQ